MQYLCFIKILYNQRVLLIKNVSFSLFITNILRSRASGYYKPALSNKCLSSGPTWVSFSSCTPRAILHFSTERLWGMVKQMILLAAPEFSYHYKMLESRDQLILLAVMSLHIVGALVRHVFSVYQGKEAKSRSSWGESDAWVRWSSWPVRAATSLLFLLVELEPILWLIWSSLLAISLPRCCSPRPTWSADPS